MTAAHCVEDIKSAQIGKYDYSIYENGTESYFTLESRSHPKFDFDTYDFDYALIKLDRKQPNSFMVSLRTNPEIPEVLTIMGWGLTSDGGFQPTTLLAADVIRFDTAQCRINYNNADLITDNMFCAEEDGIDACQGDSGGPIMIKGTNVQVGITSWGTGCANATFPGVYARIDRGYSWIEETICTDLNPDDCEADGRLPLITAEGSVQVRTCEDQEEFTGLGKKQRTRNCTWVMQYADRRCPWYGDFCPLACEVDRCKS